MTTTFATDAAGGRSCRFVMRLSPLRCVRRHPTVP
eukprot:CAMPEP_0119311902 /NCGR_PEP_ID=MMETSP1333-20130426/24416_1 /TAXON_ID=418940 /ORGANISM="Scyphosphaera apsteinii, Strain RCC1455" /LENGTH=34 /DNA_ID= /DNA_START= /DNA_END= /DNA_ORIENTATION=